jgi:hypothetical protein
MRIRGWHYSLLLVLLMLLGASLRPFAFVWAEAPAGRSPLSVSSSLERGPTQVDFDDDRVVDTLTFTARGGHPDVEIALSTTRTVLVLPVDPVSPVSGSLAVRRPPCDRPLMTVPHSALTLAMGVRRPPYRLLFQTANRTTAIRKIRTATPK